MVLRKIKERLIKLFRENYVLTFFENKALTKNFYSLTQD